MRYSRLLILAIATFAVVSGQQPQQGTISFSQPAPSSPASIGASPVGATGGTMYCYWVVAKYPIGNSSIQGPACVTNGNATLTGSNYNQVGWSTASGATGYDLLRTPIATQPTSTATIAVATNLTATSFNDTGAALASYTPTAAAGASSFITLDNMNWPMSTYVYGSPFAPLGVNALQPYSTGVDLRYFGGDCNSGASMQAALIKAIAAGFKNVKLPANCTLQPTADTLPGDVNIYGEDWNTSTIISSDIVNTNIIQGPHSVVYNVNIRGKFCTDATPAGVIKNCPIKVAGNGGDAPYPLGIWPNQYFSWVTGTSFGSNDRLGMSIIQTGVGDAIFLGVTGVGGAGLRVNPIANNSIGVLIEPGLSGILPTGVRGLRVNNYTNDAGGQAILIDRRGNSPGLAILDANVLATSGAQITSTIVSRTTGDIWDIFHTTSNWAGDMFSASMGNGGGSFGGNFFNLSNGGNSKFRLSSVGQIIIPPMASSSNINMLGIDATGAFVNTSTWQVSKALVNAAVTPIATIALPAGGMTGGELKYSVQATDGVDLQVHTGSLYYAAVNKGGVYTTQAQDEAVGADANARSAGLLAEAWTITTGVNLININAQFTSNLGGGAIVMSIKFKVLDNAGSTITFP